jgi:hypothetical protein
MREPTLCKIGCARISRALKCDVGGHKCHIKPSSPLPIVTLDIPLISMACGKKSAKNIIGETLRLITGNLLNLLHYLSEALRQPKLLIARSCRSSRPRWSERSIGCKGRKGRRQGKFVDRCTVVYNMPSQGVPSAQTRGTRNLGLSCIQSLLLMNGARVRRWERERSWLLERFLTRDWRRRGCARLVCGNHRCRACWRF